MPAPEPSTIDMVIDGPIARADLPGLCTRVRSLLETSNADLLVCDVGAIVSPDAVTVDALARLTLTVRQHGRDIRLRRASDELQDLLAFVGLHGVVPLCAVLPLGRRRQAEERKERRGAEEEDDPGDLPA